MVGEIIGAAQAHALPTPYLVVSESLLVHQTRAFLALARRHLPRVGLYYSVKTNDLPQVVRAQAGLVDGLEVIGGRELGLAAQWVSGERMILNGPNKRREEIRAALDRDVGLINLDGLDDARLLEDVANELGRNVNVGVRLNFSEAGTWDKFGLSPDGDELRELSQRVASSERLRLTTVHYHGDHVLESSGGVRPLLDRLEAAFRQLSESHPLECIDLGGGWEPVVEIGPAGEWIDDNRTEQELAAVAAHWVGSHPRLVLEPGRALVEGCLVAVSSVGPIKRDRDRTWVYLDLSTGYVGGRHPCDARVKFSLAEAAERPKERVSLCGPLCTGSDVLGDAELPAPERGDRIAMANAGAYTLTLRYHSTQPEPGIVWLGADGSTELVRATQAAV